MLVSSSDGDRHVRASHTVELAKSGEGVVDGKLCLPHGSGLVHVIVNLVQIY